MAPAAAAVGQYSSWVNRLAGYLIRAFSLAVFYVPGFILGAIFGDAGIVFIVIAYVFVIAAAIRMMIQRGHLGYDLGDRVVGQALVREATGQPMGSGWSVFGRQVAHILDALPCYLGFLWPLWDAKKQTFADKIVSTVVVTGRPQPHDAKALFVNAVQVWTPVLKS